LKIPETTPQQPDAQQQPQPPAKPEAATALLPSAPAPIPQCSPDRTEDPKHPGNCILKFNLFVRFLSSDAHRPLSTKEKARLAGHNMIDPYNAATILLSSAVSAASDSHSAYGPGMAGYGLTVGVAYSQDMTNEFFSTFLICSIAKQDPHYHRMPKASIPRRVLHTLIQPEWTQSDHGHGMLNYAFIVGSLIDGEISNLYVPGQQTRGSATAARYFAGYYAAPIDNMVTEFLPDVARKVHIRVVLVQRYINHISGASSSQP
jgi:hypothetical protein